jgi:Ca2+-transporting ATPase
VRDPLDQAFELYLKNQLGQRIGNLQLQKSLPFEYKYSLSGNVWKQAGQFWAYVKGAPEKILARANLSATERQVGEEKFRALAKMGFRVIGVARVKLNKVVTKLSRLPKNEWQFLGLVAIADGLRAGVGKAVRQAELAGVKVKMITGDHEETAWQIAEEIGLSENQSQVCNGRNLAKLKGEQLTKAVAEAKVFSRVLPEVKYKILEELNRGEITAMTGDGVNDVPALSRAHVGIAMGSGAAIAKEASDIILLDDNFRTIVKALKEGRIIIANIVKMLVYLFSTNGGEILVMLGALLLGMPLPLVAVQILWINLITDTCLVIPLGLEPGERDIMRKPPSKVEAPILSNYMLSRILVMAVGMGGTTLILFKIFLARGDLAQAQTLVFIALIAMQLISVMGMRSDFQPIWAHSWRKNWKLAGVLVLTIGLQFLVFVTPMREALHLVAVRGEDLGMVLGVSGGVVILLLEIHKWWGRKFMINRKLPQY